MKNKSILFLCSGGGGNLRFIHQAIQHGWLTGWDKISVITDRECLASNYARDQGFPVTCVDFNRDDQVALCEIAGAYNPDMIITTVHKILGKKFIEAFKGRMLNLHYSLLPAFAGSIGANPVKAAMQFGACLGGATVHKVTAEVDAGQPQAQVVFPLAPDDALENVMNVEFRVGCIALLAALCTSDALTIPDWRGRFFQIDKRHALLNPAIFLPDDLFCEDFWQQLK